MQKISDQILRGLLQGRLSWKKIEIMSALVQCKLWSVLVSAARRRAQRGNNCSRREAAGKPIEAALCLAIRVNLGLHLSREGLLALPSRQYLHYFYATNTCTTAAKSHHKTSPPAGAATLNGFHSPGSICFTRFLV